MARSDLTAARLRELFSYDCATGAFIRRTTSGRRWKAGTTPGTRCAHGYIRINVDGLLYYAHRLAWLYIYGVWPGPVVDHIDTIRDHNWIDNLRPATDALNSQNKRNASRGSTSGLLGVCWHRAGKKWAAAIEVNGKKLHLGLFEDKEEAHAKYVEKKRALHAFGTL